MDIKSWIFLPEEERKLYIAECANRVGLPQIVVEKDWWVTTVLYAIHQLPYANYLLFKGGTSLSKAFKIISRFSEDIDIAISCEYFDKKRYEDYSNGSQIRTLRKKLNKFIDTLSNDLSSVITDSNLDKFCTLTIVKASQSDEDPRTIIISYNSVLEKNSNAYAKSQVKLEIGIRSLIRPSEQSTINSMLIEQIPKLTDVYGTIKVMVSPIEKTFIEKIYLIHEIFHRSPPSIVPPNQKSRHLYDIYQIYISGKVAPLFTSNELWTTISKHRNLWCKSKGICYDSITTELTIVPTEHFYPIWNLDYNELKENFIYNNTAAPTFEELLDTIREIQEKVRKL